MRIDALVDVDNLRSQSLPAGLGLAREGLLARHTLHPNLSEVSRDVGSYAAVRTG